MWVETDLSLDPVTLNCACSDIDPSLAGTIATRVCGGSYSTRVEWSPPDISSCQASSVYAETLCNSTVSMYEALQLITHVA